MINRLAHPARIITSKGGSYRLRDGDMAARPRPAPPAPDCAPASGPAAGPRRFAR